MVVSTLSFLTSFPFLPKVWEVIGSETILWESDILPPLVDKCD